MNNPKIVALMSAVVALYLAYTIFTATEAPSTGLAAMHWLFLFLAAIACIGSLIQIAKGRKN